MSPQLFLHAFWCGGVMAVLAHPNVVRIPAALAGASPPARLDGQDFSPLLLGVPGARSPRTTLNSRYGLNQRRLESIRAGNWKPHLGSTRQLHDLAAGPAERTDLAAVQPDLVRRLTRSAEAIRRPANVPAPDYA